MLVRRNNLVPVLATNRGLDSVFEDLFRDFPLEGFAADGTRYPAVDIREDESSFHVEAEVPGLSEKDLEISVMNNELRISGNHESEKEDKSTTYHRRERFAGQFSRVLRFPVDLDPEHVEARYESGILKVVLPKATRALPRKIQVKS